MTRAKHCIRSTRGWLADGWLLIPDFLGGEQLSCLRNETERLLADAELFRERGMVANSSPRTDRLDPVIDLSPVFADLAGDPALLAVVNDALGGKAQLFKDKFIAKPPGAAGYGAHQDGAYWPGLGLDPSRFLTAVLFLDDNPVEKGPIECMRGPHTGLLTDANWIADPDDSQLGEFIPVAARAGDLLLLHAMTPHRSGPNRSNAMRRTLMFTYGVDGRSDLYGIYQRSRQTQASHRSATAVLKN